MKLKLKLAAVTLLLSQICISQVTFESNIPASGRYVGFDNSSGIPLRIENGFPEIDIISNLSNKIAITEQATWTGLNGLSRTNVQRTTMGLQGQSALGWSMLHLLDNASGGVPAAMQRPWMNVGISYTSNSDFMYSGLLERPITGASNLLTDAVIAWGCQDGATTADNFRFLFLQGTNSSPAGSEQGLEVMRITPIGNVGIGDFSSMPNGIGGITPIYGQPQARLDVQFRNTIPANTSNTAINVNNNAIDPVSGTSVKIGVNSIATANGVVSQAIGGQFRGVRGGRTYGVFATAFGSGNSASYGVWGAADEPDGEVLHVGVSGNARFGKSNVGVDGIAAQNGSQSFTAAIRGTAPGGSANNIWGGWFDGSVFTNAGYFPSDENLKVDINPIDSPTETLMQLQAKTYLYNQDITALNLTEGIQYGLIAQELEAILPELVVSIQTPNEIDENGNEIEGMPFKAIRYNDLISILIAGFQEQNGLVVAQQVENSVQFETILSLMATVENQNEQLQSQKAELESFKSEVMEKLTAVSSMQEKTNNCCQGKNPTWGAGNNGNESFTKDQLELGQNVPNPFDQNTRINFVLPADAQVVLEISDAQGRSMQKLIDGQMSEGQHGFIFDGSSLVSGIYYYTIYANGELLTKRMMKL